LDYGLRSSVHEERRATARGDGMSAGGDDPSTVNNIKPGLLGKPDREAHLRLVATRRSGFVVILAALVLVGGACGSGGGSADGGPEAETTAENGQARAIPGPNKPLTPGEYETGLFTPGFTFSVGEGWLVGYPELPDVLFIARGASPLNFINVQQVFDPSRPGEEIEEPAPEDLIAWLRRHPNLDASEPSPVTIGGVSGTRLDVVVSSTPKKYPGHCGMPCVPLFRISDGNSFWLGKGERDRVFILEDVGGETVTILIGGPPEEFDSFLPRAQEVLDTVEWKDAS
jgi:hypothetical protein